LDKTTSSMKERLIEQAELEIDNMRAAFSWSSENNDVAGALELASSLESLWVVRGRIAEGAAWLDFALKGLRDNKTEVASSIRAKAFADRATLGLWTGVDATRGTAEDAVALAREIDDPALLARALTACASSHALDYESARRYFAEATAIAR